MTVIFFLFLAGAQHHLPLLIVRTNLDHRGNRPAVVNSVRCSSFRLPGAGGFSRRPSSGSLETGQPLEVGRCLSLVRWWKREARTRETPPATCSCSVLGWCQGFWVGVFTCLRRLISLLRGHVLTVMLLSLSWQAMRSCRVCLPLAGRAAIVTRRPRAKP